MILSRSVLVSVCFLFNFNAQANNHHRVIVENELVEPVIELVKHAQLSKQLGIIKTNNVAHSFIQGKGYIGISSQRWLDSDMAEFVRRYGYQPTELFFSSDAAAILVHPENPVNAIDMPSLAKLFACNDTNISSSWNALKLSSSEDQIQTYAGLNELKQHKKFTDLVACKGEQQSSVKLLEAAQLLATLNQQPNAIAYTLYQSNFDQAKALQLIDASGDYFDLNHETILSGRYPLANVYYMYVNLAPSGNYPAPAFKQFVQYVQTQEAQQKMRKYGFIPLPEEAIQRNLVTLNQVEPEIAGGYK